MRKRTLVRENDEVSYVRDRYIVFNDYASAWVAIEQDCWHESCYPSLPL